ncbi:DUF4350 domain-containing protein [Oleiharenicola sp. Vm1]|uniref:DUF4350 domain-containing protein n=1 Tax=Oleiharenicola sp. Vm1 TaxID=3398393 RepID=UPI0039F5BEFE
MNRRAARWLGPLGAFALAAAMLGWIFSVRLGGGDVYPAYSSFRADALGTRALYEALEALPDFRVDRELRPLERLGTPPRVVFLPGLRWHEWRERPEDQLAALNAVANNGGTVVLAFQAVSKAEEEEWVAADQARRQREAEAKKKQGTEDDEPDEKKKDTARKNPPRRDRRLGKEPEVKSLAEAWQVEFKVRNLLNAKPLATRAAEAAAALPAELTWHSELVFEPKAGSPWRRLFLRGHEAVALERPLGRGRLVLLGDAYGLSNEAMQRARATALLSWLIGGHRRATFVESTLGLEAEPGVGFLARRYGLGGALALLALLAGLYLWRRAVAFYPVRDPLERGGEVALRYEPAAGLTALLRRALGAGGVLPACVAEWRATRPAGGKAAAAARLDAAWAARDPRAAPAETYNALVRALKPR